MKLGEIKMFVDKEKIIEMYFAPEEVIKYNTFVKFKTSPRLKTLKRFQFEKEYLMLIVSNYGCEGLGRDERRTTVGHHLEPRHPSPHACATGHVGLCCHRRLDHPAHGQRRSRCPPRADGNSRRQHRD